MRPIPPSAVEIVARWEGFEPVAYLCPARIPTIGYGHTKTVKSSDVGKRSIGESEARDLLAQDMLVAADALSRVLGGYVEDLNDNQYAALLSFAFNVGASPDWTIWKVIRGGRLGDVPAQLERFVFAGGKRLKGLENRRADEIALWNAPVAASAAPAELPASPTLPEPAHREEPAPTSAPPARSFWALFLTMLAGMLRRRTA